VNEVSVCGLDLFDSKKISIDVPLKHVNESSGPTTGMKFLRWQRVHGSMMPWFRRLIASLAPRRLKYKPRPFHVEFVVDKVALGHFFLPVLNFFPL